MQLNDQHAQTTTDSPNAACSESPALGTAILAAALALPGLAQADTPPEHGTISLKYLDYRDSQPGLDRITVHSPSLFVQAPIAGKWSVEGSLVSDAVSGASPRYHTAISGASKMDDRRKAADARVTRYFSQGSFGVGAAYSNEHDYRSRAVSLHGSLSSEDKNTTVNLGLGITNDDINPVNLAVVDEKKHTVEWMAGITQVMSQNDIVQVNLSHVEGRGYFSDPYKYVDNRPREREQDALLLRWNHHVDGTGGTARLSYRYYRDSYQIKAHTFGAEYVQPLSGGWTVTPSARVYSQSAASFYFDPVYDQVFGPPFPPGYVFGSSAYSSADQRLAAFGAYTLGIKVAKQITADLTFDVKFEAYEQRSNWRLFGGGSPDLDPFRAKMIQVGFSQRW